MCAGFGDLNTAVELFCSHPASGVELANWNFLICRRHRIWSSRLALFLRTLQL
jgi:hypothetical protein